MNQENAQVDRPTLSSIERRVTAVLAEKAITTPEYYPMTVAGLVSGCNQKSNRDPVSNYDADDVGETLERLRKRGVTVRFEGSGRVERWRHLLREWLAVDKPQLAVLVELMLRGPQTLGELRTRASRMHLFADLEALEPVLQTLSERRLLVYLTPPGQKRGVAVAHGLYSPEELEKVKRGFAQSSVAELEETGAGAGAGAGAGESHASGRSGSAGPPPWSEEFAGLRDEVRSLRETVEQLRSEVHELKTALGA